MCIGKTEPDIIRRVHAIGSCRDPETAASKARGRSDFIICDEEGGIPQNFKCMNIFVNGNDNTKLK